MRGTTTAAAPAAPAHARPRGGCCGYRVESPLSFRYLRPGSGSPLTVEEADDPGRDGELVMSWRAEPEYPHAVTLRRTGTRFTLRTGNLGWFQVDPRAGSILMSSSPEPLRREVGLWGIPAALCAGEQGGRAIHAAAVEVAGSSVLLAAPGHFGKTTLAAAFARAGHRVLSEDFSFCRPVPIPSLLPGPAVLRLRDDVFRGMEVPGTSVALKSMGRVFLVLDQGRRGNSAAVPLGAIIFLRRTATGVHATRVPPVQALKDLFALSFRLPTDHDRTGCFQSLAEVASRVPAWNLYRPLEFSSLDRTVDTIAALCVRS